MQTFINLDEVKRQLRVLHHHDDDVIAAYMDAAVSYVRKEIDRPLTDNECLNDSGVIHDSLRQAFILVVKGFYDGDDQSMLAAERLYKNFIRRGA